MDLHQHHDSGRMISHASWQFVNSVFLGGMLTSVLGLLPTILSCVTMVTGIIWTSLMIWESKTIQERLAARRAKRVSVEKKFIQLNIPDPQVPQIVSNSENPIHDKT